MERLPDVHFQDEEEVNWRDEPDDDDCDDEELSETPPDVIEMLGFDPLEEGDDDDRILLGTEG